MLKEGVRLDRVRGGRQKYRNRIRVVGQSSNYRSDDFNYNNDGGREIKQTLQMSEASSLSNGWEIKTPVIKTIEGI